MQAPKDLNKKLILAAKVAVGSSAAIYIAQALGLRNYTSAGIIALLTLMTTKWEAFRLSAFRLVSFVFTTFLSWLVFAHVNSAWIDYGIFIFVVMLLSEFLGWRSTISVNAVIGTHLLTTRDFSPDFLWNEFWLVLIGITIALLLNLFQDTKGSRKALLRDMRRTEERLQAVLLEFAAWLSGDQSSCDVWDSLELLESDLREDIRMAREYQENTLPSHTRYYSAYFTMRSDQCRILRGLNKEADRIRSMPRQAKVVADYVSWLSRFVVETNVPSAQQERLAHLLKSMKDEPLPGSREEFESRALLYHILLDLEEFLDCKARFVEGLSGRQLKEYWSD